MFLNWKNETIQPARFALIAWDGAAAVYAFPCSETMARAIASAHVCGAEAREISAQCAETLLAGGARGNWLEARVPGVCAAFSNLKLAA